jgi:hypothetical protein
MAAVSAGVGPMGGGGGDEAQPSIDVRETTAKRNTTRFMATSSWAGQVPARMVAVYLNH